MCVNEGVVGINLFLSEIVTRVTHQQINPLCKISLCSNLPKKINAHNVFEVTGLCRTQADVLKPTLDRTLVASQITEM